MLIDSGDGNEDNYGHETVPAFRAMPQTGDVMAWPAGIRVMGRTNLRSGP